MTETAYEVPLTVRDVLALPVMSDSRVLAGSTGLERAVLGVNVIGVPDIDRWLRGGEFLFTAGYSWRHQAEQFAALLPELERIGIAGVGVKLGSYLFEVPGSVLEAADRCGIPLLSIASDVRYMAVFEPLHQRLRANRLWVLERSDEANGRLLAAGIGYRSVGRVSSALADEVGNPVYVFDEVARTGIIARPSERLRTIPLDDLEGAKDHDTAVLMEVRERFRAPAPTSTVLSVGRSIGMGLVGDNEVEGAVAVVEEATPFDDVVSLALTQTSELIALIQFAQISRLAGRIDASRLLIEALLGAPANREELAERALAVGLRLTEPCIGYVAGSTDGPLEQDTATRAWRSISRRLGGMPHALAWLEDRGSLTVLLHATDDPRERRRVAGAIEDGLRDALVERPLLGHGDGYRGVHGARGALSEAIVAFEFGRRGGRSGAVCFADLGTKRVLSQFVLNEATQNYVERTIGPVLHRRDLFHTLVTYLECGGSKAATTRSLRLHRSSLMYRLERIAALLETDIDDPAHQYELWLAVHLRELLCRTTAVEAVLGCC